MAAITRATDDGAFEALLWELFLRFVDVPAERVDLEIRNAQRLICTALGLERSTLWQSRPDEPATIFLTHAYDDCQDQLPVDEIKGSLRVGVTNVFLSRTGEAHPELESLDEHFPWVSRRLAMGLTTVIPSVDALPPEASVDRDYFRRFGTLATVVVPLRAESVALGALSFASTRGCRAWPDDDVRRVELVAQVFARALNATRMSRLLRESEAINRATFKQAAIGIAHVAADGRWLRVNDKLCDILGYTHEELVGGMTFQQVTLPDDLAADLDFMRATLAGRQSAFTLEKRYRRRNGSTIWVNVTASLVRDCSGRPDFFIGIIEDITGRKQVEAELARTHAQVQRLSEQLTRENTYLRQEVTVRKSGGRIVGQSPAIRASLAEAEQVAATDSTVLLLGETGTGKELFAEAIHQWSARRDRTMVRVNCAAIPTTLLESELFGREKGAFTGALARQIGRFELAHGSTIFLDEIGDLPPEVQVKLLRVIEGRRLERLGSPNPVTVDVRIIAATHRDLGAAVRLGQFREDLYYRLNVFPIVLPRLRDRLEDLPLLARAMLDDLGKSMGKRFDPPGRTALQALQRHHWPGNIRELRNVIERAMITSTPPTLTVLLPAPVSDEDDPASGGTLQAVEKARILEVLARTGWRIRGAKGAAAVLGLPPTTLENRMKRLNISRPTASHD